MIRPPICIHGRYSCYCPESCFDQIIKLRPHFVDCRNTCEPADSVACFPGGTVHSGLLEARTLEGSILAGMAAKDSNALAKQ